MKHESKYKPHQGKKECARRVKQIQNLKLKQEIKKMFIGAKQGKEFKE